MISREGPALALEFSASGRRRCPEPDDEMHGTFRARHDAGGREDEIGSSVSEVRSLTRASGNRMAACPVFWLRERMGSGGLPSLQI